MTFRTTRIVLVFAALGLGSSERGGAAAMTEETERASRPVATEGSVIKLAQARNRRPVIGSIGDRRVQEGALFSLRPRDFIFDRDGDRFSIEVRENVSWLSFRRGTLSGRPDGLDAPAVVRVRAIDRHGASSAEKSFRVSIRKSGARGGRSGNAPNDNAAISDIIPAISATGRFVAHVAQESSDDLEGSLLEGINVRDTGSGALWPVFRVEATFADHPNGEFVSNPAISADGRIVAFFETAGEAEVRVVRIADADPLRVILVRTLSSELGFSRETARAAVVSLSSDGRFIAFEDDVDIVVAKIDAMGQTAIDTGSNPSISRTGQQIAYQRAGEVVIATLATDRVSVIDTAVIGPGSNPVVSADGRVVAFESEACLVQDDINGAQDIFVYDVASSALARANVDANGDQADDGFSNPSLSADGSLIAFDLGEDGTVLVRELDEQAEPRGELRNVGSLAGNDMSAQPALSANKRFVAFMFDGFEVFSVPVLLDRAPVVDFDFPADPSDDTSTRAVLRLRAVDADSDAGCARSEIGPALDKDWYRVELNGEQTYRFELQADPSNDTPLGDPYLELLDENGNLFASNDDSGGFDARLDFPVASGGTYFVVARAYSNETGDYVLSVVRPPPAVTVSR